MLAKVAKLLAQEKNVKLIKANKPEGRLAEEVLTGLLDHMNNGFAARSFERNSKENPVIKNLFLLQLHDMHPLYQTKFF